VKGEQDFEQLHESPEDTLDDQFPKVSLFKRISTAERFRVEGFEGKRGKRGREGKRGRGEKENLHRDHHHIVVQSW
jgi:hypothetical protein